MARDRARQTRYPGNASSSLPTRADDCYARAVVGEIPAGVFVSAQWRVKIFKTGYVS